MMDTGDEDRVGKQTEATAASVADNLVRPVWVLAWVSLAYSALALVPTSLPVYGTVLPGTWWWGLPLELLSLLGIAAYTEVSRRPGAWQWIAAALAGPGTALFFTMGVLLLLAGTFDAVSIGIAGAFGLGMLVWIDRLATQLESSGRSLAKLLSS